MAKAYSDDLRSRVVEVLMAGSTVRAAAQRFNVGVSSVVRWGQRFRDTGSVSPKPLGVKRGSCLAGHREWLLARIAAAPDLTLEEIRSELAARGVGVGYGTVWRFFAGEGVTFKKNRTRQRAGSAGRSRRPSAVATGSAGARPAPSRLHRRDMGQDQHGPEERALPPR